MILPCQIIGGMVKVLLPAKTRANSDRLVDALLARQSNVIHLTHNDLDAVGADAVHRMAYSEVFSIFSSVGGFLPILEKVVGTPGKGDLLSITDLGYQPGADGLLKRGISNGWRVEWRDHHRWEENEEREIRSLAQVLHIDTALCACGIVARDLQPSNPVAREVAAVVCDYDLWWNREPRAGILARVVSREENRSYVRDCLVKGVFSDSFIEGQYRTIQREMEEAIRKSIRRTRMYGTKYRIAIAPLYGYPSETAAAIRQVMGSEIEVLVSTTGRFSIRSVPPISHLIAREFQGGGHAHAAGGSLNFSLWDRIAFFLMHRTPHYPRLVTVAETKE